LMPKKIDNKLQSLLKNSACLYTIKWLTVS
jgi:hypothetical protein